MNSATRSSLDTAEILQGQRKSKGQLTVRRPRQAAPQAAHLPNLSLTISCMRSRRHPWACGCWRPWPLCRGQTLRQESHTLMLQPAPQLQGEQRGRGRWSHTRQHMGGQVTSGERAGAGRSTPTCGLVSFRCVGAGGVMGVLRCDEVHKGGGGGCSNNARGGGEPHCQHLHLAFAILDLQKRQGRESTNGQAMVGFGPPPVVVQIGVAGGASRPGPPRQCNSPAANQ